MFGKDMNEKLTKRQILQKNKMSTQKYYKINKLNRGKLHRQKDEHKLAAAVQ